MRRPTSALLIALVLGAMASAVPAQEADSPDPERLLFLLEYIGADYGGAVQNGTIASAFEYQEMLTFSDLVIERFDVLRDHGATEEVRTGLLRLQGLIHGLAPSDEVRALTARLASTLFDELEVASSPAVTPDLGRGEVLYADNCAACHGPAGAGDGFGDPQMDPPATSFFDERMSLLSPHQVYGAINFGIDGTAMPSYLDALPPQQLWDITFHVLLPRAAELALPIDLAMNIYHALKIAESKRSPWLGFSVLELAAVTRRGADPAPRLNLPPTGVYTDGHRLFSVLDFQKWLYLSGIGRTIELEIYCDGKTLKKNATVEERPASAMNR